jgi:hypothetical protein
VLSQVILKKLTVGLTHFATDFALERLYNEDVFIRVNESCVSTTPRLIFWFSNEFDPFVLEASIGLVNIVNQ